MGLIEFIMMKNLFGGSGGNAVDDGYYIAWDGNNDGLDTAIVQGIPLWFKVSDIIIEPERLEGCILYVGNSDEESSPYVLNIDDMTVLVLNDEPFAFSGKAGDYSYAGLSVTVPSDGTYFLDGVGYTVTKLYKPAAS